jgi:uncharacterized protein YbjT (DUF2867 family)
VKVLVLGATGGTGRLIVRDAVAKGHSVDGAGSLKGPRLRPCGSHLIEGDARDESAPIRALDGCDAVVSSLGVAARNDERPDAQ